MSNSVQPRGQQPTRLLCPQDSLGKNTGEPSIPQFCFFSFFLFFFFFAVTLSTIQSMEFSRPEYWSGQPFPSPGDRLNPEIESWSPTLEVDSLAAEPPGKPKNIGVGSLFLLQQIFPTQESNRGFLHCRQILYQLSYQGICCNYSGQLNEFL